MKKKVYLFFFFFFPKKIINSILNLNFLIASDLLAWIKAKTESLDDRQFPNKVSGIQDLQSKFKEYFTNEKVYFTIK